MIKLKLLIIWVLFLNCSPWVFSNPTFRNSKEYEILHTKEKLIVDGLPSETIWEKSKYADDFSVYRTHKKPKNDTKFKLCYDDEFLYLFVELQNFEVINEGDKKRVLEINYFEFYIMPDLNAKKLVQILIAEDGRVVKKILDSVSQQESQLNVKVEFNHSKTKAGVTSFEIKLNLDEIGFLGGEFAPFLFNITRSCTKVEEMNLSPTQLSEKQKKTIKEEELSAWSPIGYQSNNFYTFGIVNVKGKSLKLPSVNQNNQLLYFESFINSVDVYYKAVNGFDGLVPEGVEVTHDASMAETDHIPIAQYPCKIDGYYRLFWKTNIKEYQSLAHQIIDKMFLIYTSTKDFNGERWLPFCQIVDRKGVSHAYDRGPKNKRYFPLMILFNQTEAPFEIKQNAYADSFGFGMLQISENWGIIDEVYRKKLLEIIEGMVKFYQQEHVLNSNENNFFWQTNTFKPKEKPSNVKIEKPQLFLMGQDIVYLYLAGINFESQYKELYIKDLKRFFDFYLMEREKLPLRTFENSNWLNKQLWRIEYLDLRIVKILEILSVHDKEWAQNNKEKVVKLLEKSYREMPIVKYSEEGLTTKSDSTLLTLYIYDFIKSSNLKRIIDSYLYYNFSYNGLYMGKSETIELNTSTYDIVKYMAYYLWQNNNDLSYLIPETINNIATILNRKNEVMDNEKWCNTEIKEHKKLTIWRAVPFRCYVENTQSEGVWKGNEKQAFLGLWGGSEAKSSNHVSKLEDSFYRFSYYQFTAPFQVHAEPFPYGKAMTFNMIKTLSANRIDTSLVLECEIEENLPLGSPVFGIADITDFVYMNKSLYLPTNLYPIAIQCEEYKFKFKETGIAEYDFPSSKVDNRKIIFITEFNGKSKFKIEIEFKEINKRKLIDLNE